MIFLNINFMLYSSMFFWFSNLTKIYTSYIEQIAYGTKNDKKSAFFSNNVIENGLYNRKKRKNLIPLIAKKQNQGFRFYFCFLSKAREKKQW